MAAVKKEALSCSECGARACYRQDKAQPSFCLTAAADPQAVAASVRLYRGRGPDAKLARAAAEIEGEYYGRLTRLEETIVFAEKIKAVKVGLASCIGLLDEAALFAGILRTAGLEPRTVICKIGAVDKTALGVEEALKVLPGSHEACCNPVLQARTLNEWGSQLNVLLGLCVGHDALFVKHSRAPSTTLIVKDRVLGHNPAAAFHNSKFYYRRVLNRADFPGPRSMPEKAAAPAQGRRKPGAS